MYNFKFVKKIMKLGIFSFGEKYERDLDSSPWQLYIYNRIYPNNPFDKNKNNFD